MFAGGVSYAIELSILLILHKTIGYSVEIATALAFWTGLLSSFILQKLLAFGDYEKTIRTISRQVGRYSLLVGFNYLFTLSFVALFPSKFIIITRTIALVLTTLWNYVIYKNFIFTNK